MDKFFKIMIIAFVAGMILLVYFIDSQAINKRQMGKELQPPRSCMTEQEVEDSIDRWIIECKDNFEHHGFESAEKCHLEMIALFDPRICGEN